MTDGPLIVQSDKTLLLEVDHPGAEDARRAIAPSPSSSAPGARAYLPRHPAGPVERARGRPRRRVRGQRALTHSRYAVPQALLIDIAETMDRYGRLSLEKDPSHGLTLHTTDRPVLEEVLRHKRIQPCWEPGSTTSPSPYTLRSAGISSRSCSRSAGRPRTWPVTSTARRTPSSWTPPSGRCGRTSSRRSTGSGTAAPVSSSCRVVPGRRSSAPERWPPRPLRRSSS